MFTIYSIGDSAFLAQILNAVAMICGTGRFEQLVACGMLFGIFVIAIQCIFSGAQQFNLHHVLIGFLAYMVMFGPAVTVNVEDVYSGENRAVDNVPIGSAVAGSIISNIGYGITSLFEQGFSPLDRMTEHRYNESLRYLTDLQAKCGDSSVFQSINSVDGGQSDSRMNLRNYIQDCSMRLIEKKVRTPEDFATGNIDAMLYDSKIYGTTMKINGTVQNLTCRDASARFTAELRKLTDPRVATQLNILAGAPKEAGSQAVPNSLDVVKNNLDVLQMAGTSGQDYVRTCIIQNVYDLASIGYYRNKNDVAAATMVTQAIAQRNLQWATEQTMFTQTMRPLMAFFEGFIYAITPVMAFMMVIGSFGISLIIKYFQVTMWIQLWMPVLSICNLYVNMAARAELTSYRTLDFSMYTLNNMNQVMSTYLGIGGMLAAATPMIALFLITGSTYAFTTMAGRLGGQDHINEKIGAADTVTPGAAMNIAPGHTYSGGEGRMQSGAESTVPMISQAKSANATLQRAMQEKVGITNAGAQELTRRMADGKTDSEMISAARNVGQSLRMSDQKAYQTALNEAKSRGLDVGKSVQQDDMIAGTMALSAVGGVNANRGGKATNTTSDSQSDSLRTTLDRGFAWLKSLGVSGPTGTPALTGPGGTTPAPQQPTEKPISTLESKTSNSKQSESGVGVNTGLNIRGEATNVTQNRKAMQAGGNKTDNKAATLSHADRAAFEKAAQIGLTKTAQTTFTDTQSMENATGFSKTLARIKQADDNFTKAQQVTNSSAMNRSVKLSTFARDVNNNSEAYSALQSAWRDAQPMSFADREAVARSQAEYEKHGIAEDQANTMARIEYLYNHSAESLNGTWDAVFGSNSGGFIATPDGKNLQPHPENLHFNQPDQKGLDQTIGSSGLQRDNEAFDAISRDIKESGNPEKANLNNPLDLANGEVGQLYKEGRDRVHDQWGDNRGAIASLNIKDALKGLKADPSVSVGSRFANAIERLGSIMDTPEQRMQNASPYLTTAQSVAFMEYQSGSDTLSERTRAFLTEDTKRLLPQGKNESDQAYNSRINEVVNDISKHLSVAGKQGLGHIAPVAELNQATLGDQSRYKWMTPNEKIRPIDSSGTIHNEKITDMIPGK